MHMFFKVVTAALLAAATTAYSQIDASPRTAYRGVDISMLPVLEHAGAPFPPPGNPGELPALLANAGCNLFRLRLFVDPDPDYRATAGAVQDLKSTLALAARIKAAGGAILLDLHYSDTWADPKQQLKPRAWADLHGEALRRHVTDYTRTTLTAFKEAGVLPEMVQIGNEIAPGMLWPDGQLFKRKDDRTDAQAWTDFAALLNAGIRGVRAVQDPAHPIRVVIHIHGGGKPGLPAWFFKTLTQYLTDFDIIGLSFYPGNQESLDVLKTNLAALAPFRRDILIVETAYPNRPLKEVAGQGIDFPTTPQGQKDYLLALQKTLADVPDGRGIGFVYWYPEAIRIPNMFIWQDGGLALFDEHGKPLPALGAFRPQIQSSPNRSPTTGR